MVGGKSGSTGGSGSDYICFPTSYTPPSNVDSYQNAERGKIYGVELQSSSSDIPFGTSSDQKPPACAVCHALSAKAIVTVPGKWTCPTGFEVEYTGYLVSEGSADSQTAKGFACLDSSPAFVTTTSQSDQAKVYAVQVNCGTLDCSTYTDHAKLKCAVCSK